jgi:hypothetical protein
MAAILGRLGLLRLLGWMASKLGRPEPELGFAAETFETLAAVGSRPRVIEGSAREMEDGDRSDLVAAALPRRIDVPLRVLTATETLGPAEELPTGFDRDAYNRLWREENARFLELSGDARQIMVEGDHLVPLGQPDLVEDLIRELVTEARARARRGSGEAPERS